MTHWTESLFVERPELFVGDLTARADEAPDEVDDLLSLLAERHDRQLAERQDLQLDGRNDRQPATVLDAGCGIGRHAVALAERGVATTGVDLSPAFVGRARERAADAGVADRTRFLAADLRDLPVDGRFDLVLNAWTTFGYYDRETNRAMLAALHDRVAADGALVVELANKEGVLADFDDDGVVTVGDTHVVETREYDPETSRMVTERWVHDATMGERLGTYELDLRMYAPVELRRLCEDVGFDEVTLYAGFDGGALTHESTRLMVVAEC